MPHVIVIAGPNGAGKTTAASALLDKALNIGHFVNADTIAAGLSAFSPETVALPTGRAMLSRMHDLAYANNEILIYKSALWQSLVVKYDKSG